MIGIARLDHPIRNYAWGSRHLIAELLGKPTPAAEPQAELWMGAHPALPSRVRRDGDSLSLLGLVDSDPAAVLGPAVVAQFSGALPFLFKLLAVAQPLSIQAHPNAAQAREGFARENAAGIAVTAPDRNYRDASHKPELLCALSPFAALRGFRELDSMLELFDRLALSGLGARLADLRGQQDADGLARFFGALMTLPDQTRREIVGEAVSAATARTGENEAFDWVGRLNAEYPGDVGVLAPLLLNVVRLEPGEAMYLPAGELHAYLDGFGVEIMANSDNVLRGGLTPKHVDVRELLRTLRFEAGPVERLAPRRVSDSESAYVCPAAEFRLSVIDVAEGTRYEGADERSVEILLCTEGAARVTEGKRALDIARGDVLLAPACVGAYTLEGSARVYKAAVPLNA